MIVTLRLLTRSRACRKPLSDVSRCQFCLYKIAPTNNFRRIPFSAWFWLLDNVIDPFKCGEF